MKAPIRIALLVSAAMCAASLAHATESMLPTGFLGDWCVTKSDERNAPPPWNYIAYRKEVVGPCKNILTIRKTSLRQGKDNCKMDDNLRTMLHTQLIRYTAGMGKRASSKSWPSPRIGLATAWTCST